MKSEHFFKIFQWSCIAVIYRFSVAFIILCCITDSLIAPVNSTYCMCVHVCCVQMSIGGDSIVNVYALSSASESEVKPVFMHTGHKSIAGMAEPTVWTTCWQPGSVPNSVLSTASDGSLHAWQFIPGSH